MAATIGEAYAINCTVTGAESLTGATITYRWFKNGELMADERAVTLFFVSLSFSDAGRYACQVSVQSNQLSGPIANTSTNSLNIVLTRK